VKSRALQSPVDTVVVCTFMSTSFSLGTGFSTSLNCRRSGDPNFVFNTPLISFPPDLLSFLDI